MFLVGFIKRLVFWTIVILAAVAVFLSQCSVEDMYRDLTSKVSDQMTSSVTVPDEAAPLVNSVKASLARELGVSADQLSVTRTEFMLWPDTCYGLALEKRVCRSVVTPGYKIVLKMNGTEYEYRGDTKGGFERKV